MVVTGLFIIYLSACIGWANAMQSDVKLEPPIIEIKEYIDQSPILVPEIGPPPHMPSLIHQGSNYFFGLPLPMVSGFFPPTPPAVQPILTEVKEECNDATCPVIKVNEVVPVPSVPLPSPDVSTNLNPVPQLPVIPVPNTPIVIEEPVVKCDTLDHVENIPPPPELPPLVIEEIPKPVIVQEKEIIPIATAPAIPPIQPHPPALIPVEPIVIEEPLLPTPELPKIHVENIPPPPQLPPVVLEDIVRPAIVEEKRVILVPSPPEIHSILPPPPSHLVGKPCAQPTLCVQNIVFERVLPNIYERPVELISIPAAKRFPIVVTSLLPFMKK